MASLLLARYHVLLFQLISLPLSSDAVRSSLYLSQMAFIGVRLGKEERKALQLRESYQKIPH